MSNLLGKVELHNPYPRQDYDKEDVKRLRSFRQSVSKKFKTKFYELSRDWRTNPGATHWLITNHMENFDLWYYPELDIHKYSALLANTSEDQWFDYWWDSEKFDWKNASGCLCYNKESLFDKWWDPEKFNWEFSSYLPEWCPNHFEKWHLKDKIHYSYMMANSMSWPFSDRFEEWWDDRFIEDIDASHYITLISRLAYTVDCKYFDKYFVKEKLTYNRHLLNYLIKYQSSHFEKWWDSELMNDYLWTSCSWQLASMCSDHFDLWWDKDKFHYMKETNPDSHMRWRKYGRHSLIQYCSDHFDKWWDKKRIRANKENYDLLVKYCPDQEEIWGPDYLILRLREEQ